MADFGVFGGDLYDCRICRYAGLSLGSSRMGSQSFAFSMDAAVSLGRLLPRASRYVPIVPNGPNANVFDGMYSGGDRIVLAGTIRGGLGRFRRSLVGGAEAVAFICR